MKRGAWFILCLICGLQLSAQNLIDLHPATKNGKWGFINRSGAFVIQARYERCIPFETRDYTWVQLENKQYIIGRDGEVLNQISVSDIVDIKDDYIIFKRDMRFGVMHKDGHIIIHPIYLNISYVNSTNQFIVYAEDGYGLMNANGLSILKSTFRSLRFERQFYLAKIDSLTFTVYNPKGQQLIEEPLLAVEVESPYLVGKDSNELLVFYDSLGNELIRGPYTDIKKVHQEHFVLETVDTPYLYDASEGLIVDSNYIDYMFFNQECILVRSTAGLYGLWDVDKNSLVMKAELESIANFDTLNLYKIRQNGRFGLADNNYNIIVPSTFDDIGPVKQEKFIITRKNNVFGIIDLQGTEIFKPRFSFINIDESVIKTRNSNGVYLFEHNGLGQITDSILFTNVAAVNLGGQIQVNMDGNRSGVGTSRGQVSRFWDQVKGKWGLRDSTGNTIIAPTFDDIIKIDGTPYVYASVDVPNYVLRTPVFRIKVKKLYTLVNEDQFKIVGQTKNYYIDTASLRDTSLAVTRFMAMNTKFYLMQKASERTKNINSGFIGDFHEGMARVFIGSRYGISKKKYKKQKRVASISTYLRLFDFDITLRGRSTPVRQYSIMGRGTWVYIDVNGDYVLPFDLFKDLALEEPQDFKHGKAIVGSAGKYGIINQQMNFVVNAKHHKITRLKGSNDSLFKVVTSQALYGYVSETGELISEPLYPFASDYTSGFAFVKHGAGLTLLNKSGTKIYHFDGGRKHTSFSDGYAGLATTHRFAIIDSFGISRTPELFSRVGQMKSGLMPCNRKGYYGYIDRSGNFKIPSIYSKAYAFHGDVAIVRTGLRRKKRKYQDDKIAKRRYGVINSSNEYVVKPKYQKIWQFDVHGYAIVKRRGKLGLIDTSGRLLLKTKFKKIFTSKDAIVGMKANGYCYFYTSNGKYLRKLPGKVQSAFRNGYIVIKKRKGYGLASETGQWVLQPVYGKLSTVSNGMLACQDRYQILVLNTSGDTLSRFNGRFIDGFYNGWLLTKSGNQFAYRSPYGQLGFNTLFDIAEPLYSGQSVVALDKKYGVIDSNGYYRIFPEYSRIYDRTDGVYRVMKQHHVGLCDLQGRFIIAPQCEDISYIADDDIYVFKYNNRFGYFNKDGSLIYTDPGLDLIYNSVESGTGTHSK